ncbi:thiamine pyrophosphate-dependent dehydrogenase E1 component subunit alpha [Inquilinus limosus]|uniref:thiamine pyrophosphate-dependent dehydrogenase E1 component subunit alpha n=1 Tax=Inquilinus limosus TaxID=171674 RepID=UPI0003F6AFFA|nr:thiamine pyrophosphate-dependent dehydrogenase E1 component subunit alpha [Inquilinus limosus]
MQHSRDFLLDSYRSMVTIRRFEDRVHDEFAAGKIPGFVHLYAGEEASAVGVCSNLDARDAIASTHRGHGHCIAKGCDVTAMMKEIYGRRGGLCGGKGGSMHIADLSKGMMGANGIVGGGPPLICGAALTAKYLKTGGVAVAFVGDGGSNQGTTLESYNLAKVWNLPVIFVIEDNGYAEATSSAWSVGGSQLGRAAGFGIPAAEVDGFDFFAVHDTAREAVERARTGGGPSLLHVKLTRFYGHFEGDAMTYRGQGEVARLRDENDCLRIFRRKVTAAGLLDDAALDAVEAEVSGQIDGAVREAETDALPRAADLATDVYVRY